MPIGRVVGLAAFAGAAAGSTVLGVAARRRALAGVEPGASPAWDELHTPVHGRAVTVRAADRTRLHAEVLGPDDAPTVVLAHGYGLSQHAWHYQRRDLSSRFRLVCYDQRGHGASAQAVSGDYSMAALGRDLATVIGTLVPTGKRALLAGHSMGGMAVLSFARQYPEHVARKVGGVFLVSTSAGNIVAGGAFSAGAATLSALRASRLGSRIPFLGRPADGGPGRDGTPGDQGADPGDWTDTPPADTVFLLTRALGLSPDADPAHVAFTEQLLTECPGRVKAALGPTLTSLNLGDAASLIPVPAVVAVGNHDRLTPIAQARRLADRLPESQLVVLPGAGHMAPLEANEQVTAEIAALADRVFGGGR